MTLASATAEWVRMTSSTSPAEMFFGVADDDVPAAAVDVDVSEVVDDPRSPVHSQPSSSSAPVLRDSSM